MNKKAINARTDDIGALRYNAMLYLPRFRDYACIDATDKTKSHRGFNNACTGRMLCPQALLEEFDLDPEAYVSLFN